MIRYGALPRWLLVAGALLAHPTWASGQVLERQERTDEYGDHTAIFTGYFGILAPLSNLTTGPEGLSTEVSLSTAFGGEIDFFLPNGLGVGFQGIYAPAEITLQSNEINVPPIELGNANWLAVSGNLMYRVDLEGPAGVVEPYVAVGGGIRRLTFEAAASEQVTNSTDGMGTLGAGALVLVSSSFAFRVEFRTYVSRFTSAVEDASRTQWDTALLVGLAVGL